MKYISIFLLLISWQGLAQKVYKFEDFQNALLANHPLLKQTNARINQANAEVQIAKGAFDPVLKFENSQKTLNSTNYYNYNTTEIVYQSPYAVKLKSGIETTKGGFINPEQSAGSLGYLGIEIPLLNGLLFDYKRAALAKSRIYFSQSEIEKKIILNDLIYESSIAYWNWTIDYNQLKIISEYENKAYARFKLINVTFKNGDRALIDTVEAATQWQNIAQLKLEADLSYRKSTLDLSKYLWDNTENPYIIDPSYIPDLIGLDLLMPKNQYNTLKVNLINENPQLQEYQLKIKGLEVSKRLFNQQLLPEINLKANLLEQRNLPIDVVFAQPVNQNYKFGLDFRFPLLMRESRGNLNLNKYQIVENKSILSQKSREIDLKLMQVGVEIDNYISQNELFLNQENRYKLLLNNEELKFAQGESNLFLINARENKLLETLNKRQEIKNKLIEKFIWQQGLAGVLYKN